MSGTYAWRPDARTVAEATLTAFLARHGLPDYDALHARADASPEWFWNAVIEAFGIAFSTPYTEIMDRSGGDPWTRWCVGGETNLAAICLDPGRHDDHGEAIVWESEAGEVRRWDRAGLREETARLVHVLRAEGLGPGDAVGLYLPMLPETVAAFFAVAALGGIVVPLFSGFAADAAADRLNDAGAVALLTAGSTSRRGRRVAMKPVADAIAARVPTLRRTFVLRDPDDDAANWDDARDRDWRALCADAPDGWDPLPRPADAPFMLIYTSGTTGRAKGTVHTHCGFPVKLAADFGLSLDFHAGDRFLWMSDMGWVVGPMQAVVSTLLGGTLVLAEGAPDWPDPGRLWRLVERHHVSYLGVAPTVARALMRHGPEPVAAADLASLRLVVSSGEPWNPDSWQWFFAHVCRSRVPILNVSGGTEIGWGILTGTPLHPLKPCAFAGPCLGMGVDIVDAEGLPVADGEVGELVLRQPSIGLTRGLWHDPDRYLESYWNTLPGLWVHGDWASRDADGMWYIHGRSDDTIKLAGKRTGPAEIESLLMGTGAVHEAAACGIADPVKGQAVALAVVPAPGEASGPELAARLADAVVDGLGAPFRPARVAFVDALPKTRSQKVMRRVVRAVFEGRDPGDLAALVNPEAVDGLRARVDDA
ncbi:MAG: AMP-binding protein [Gammaproteobacteria bacterium]|nr:AMP-binding protein [Gammaproteobacteria bacterium]